MKDEAIFCNSSPINVTFHDMKKFDLVNPVIAKLATQVRASKLTDYQLTKKILNQGEVDNLQLRLDALKYGINKDDDAMRVEVVAVVEKATMERLVQVYHHQKLHNKK